MNNLKLFFKNNKKDIKLSHLKLINKKLFDKNKDMITLLKGGNKDVK